jgi:hypothetical protein
LGRIFYSVPVIGWLAKDAVHGTDEAKYFFLFNVFVVLAGAVYVVGYPLAITLALVGTGLGLGWVILLSMGDVIDKLMTRPAMAGHDKPAIAASAAFDPPAEEPVRQAA